MNRLLITEIEGVLREDVKLELDEVGAKLVIGTDITGYTLSFIYGTGGSNNERQLKYRQIVVPTYSLELYDSENKMLEEYHVTRDSWYYRGFKDEKPDYNPFPPYDSCKLVNRHFNPANNYKNLYNLVGQIYPKQSKLEGFSIQQYDKTTINAECHRIEQNTYLDGSYVEGYREDLCKAEDVMLHIGGWFEIFGKHKLAGSEGCFGFIPIHQKFDTANEVEKILKNGEFINWEISNKEYKKFMNKIYEIRKGKKLHLLINKRGSVEIFKNAEYV